MYDNNNEEVPTMVPAMDNKMSSAVSTVSTVSHIPLAQWKAAADTRLHNGEMKWKSKFEESEKKRKSLLTQSQKCNCDRQAIRHS
jgi:hypothetical protein